MSRKSSRVIGKGGNGNTQTLERNRRIEIGIDALNALRVETRRAGMIACADALDEAFALCLRDYMVLKTGEPPETEGRDVEGDDRSD